VLICVGDHVLQEFNTLFLIRFQNLQNFSAAKSLYRFLENDIWGIAFYQSNLSTVWIYYILKVVLDGGFLVVWKG
jgi:hypothetical protein